MNGGYFQYQQYRFTEIAETIEEVIQQNNNTGLNRWGDQIGYEYSEATIKELKIAVKLLKQAYIYAQRIDWLLSADDGEESFHNRLREELNAQNY